MNPSEVMELSTTLTWKDTLRNWGYRWDIGRMKAIVRPGLYKIGNPDSSSEVLLSCNYRMSVDVLRSSLKNRNVWILIIDTKGINVWCAAGKGTFGTVEICRRVIASGLKDIVLHRRLIAPQLGAPGMEAHRIKKVTGFKVFFGPVHARDTGKYMDAGLKADAEMRKVTFTFADRIVLAPVEFRASLNKILMISMAVLLLAGIKGTLFLLAVSTTASFAVPAFHNLLIGRWLSIKGFFWGMIASTLMYYLLSNVRIPSFYFIKEGDMDFCAVLSYFTLAIPAASYIGLNFTGSTTYTSVTGVEREMQLALPFILFMFVIGSFFHIFLLIRGFL